MGRVMEYYRIKGLCSGLDGLIAEVSPDAEAGYRTVARLINDSIVFGDRQVILPVSNGLRIYGDFLEKCDDPTKRQFASDNPYGDHVYSKDYMLGNVQVASVRMTSAIIVTMRDIGSNPPRTLFSRTYITPSEWDDVNESLHRLETQQVDADDILFELKHIGEKQSRETD